MSAETIAKALGGRKVGSDWMTRCPAHDDSIPSLSLRDSDTGKVLVRCHAGCPQEVVIWVLKSKGLWTVNSKQRLRQITPSNTRERIEQDQDASRRSKFALDLWQSGEASAGTLVETYLRSRGLHRSPPPALRFHPHLKHPTCSTWPAMVALVTRGTDRSPIAIHRTFLTNDGFGKAPVVPQKMMLGPCRGGAVRLGEPSDVLMVGEGIETCLAVMQQTGQPAWAALSTSGLRTLDLPQGVREVIVLADSDDPGEAAALDCALRWKRQGRRVRIARPPKGMDFNDMICPYPTRTVSHD